jgi:hypothetical protein
MPKVKSKSKGPKSAESEVESFRRDFGPFAAAEATRMAMCHYPRSTDQESRHRYAALFSRFFRVCNLVQTPKLSERMITVSSHHLRRLRPEKLGHGEWP